MLNRKYIFIFIGLLAVAILFLPSKKETPIAPTDETLAGEEERKANGTTRVTRVIDGDTLAVEVDGEEQKIRLLGVDAAEIDFQDEERTTKRECYSLEAQSELKRLTLGNEIALESDPLNDDKDEYGRFLRYVFLSDGSLINDILIKTGFVRHLSFFSLTLNEQFAESEKYAKENNLGLWAVCP